MAAVIISTMINNKVLLLISFKFNHAELIGNHYFGIYGITEINKLSYNVEH